MKRILLACIALALPSFVAAAPCDILPYANQCQGSNFWPAPAGWGSHSNTTCQPRPSEFWYWPIYSNGGSPSTSSCGTQVQHGWFVGVDSANLVLDRHAHTHPCPDDAKLLTLEFHYSTYNTSGVETSRNYRYTWSYPSTPNTVHTSGITISNLNDPDGEYARNYIWPKSPLLSYSAAFTPTLLKPSNGVCTARWTSSAQTALQKDPLDPDCDANSCVFDGTCRLR